jgi:hypothetical protein
MKKLKPKRPKLSKAEIAAKDEARWLARRERDKAHDAAARRIRAREARAKRRLALAEAMGITLLPWPTEESVKALARHG